MTIRKRVLTSIVAIFIINIIMLLGFYKYYIYNSNSKQIELIRNGLINTIERNISDTDERENLIGEFNQQFEVNAYRDNSALKLIQIILKFEIVVLSIILVIASIIIYSTFIKPIELLNKNMDNFTLGIPLMRFKKKKDEIGKLQESFVQLTDRILKEQDKQNKIVASISHDIKTPLTSIMGYSERLMKKEFPKEKQVKYLNRIYSKSLIINELINEFDEFLIYNFEKELNLKEYDVNYICNHILDEYKGELKDIGVEFELINRVKKGKISIDLIKFKRVIGNIISNSIKSIEGKGKIDVEVIVEEDYILFKIEDNGKGVNESILPNIFDPLFTTDNSRKVAGLGLAICKNIVLSHKGKIVAENCKIQGFRIKIYIPMVKERI